MHLLKAGSMPFRFYIPGLSILPGAVNLEKNQLFVQNKKKERRDRERDDPGFG